MTTTNDKGRVLLCTPDWAYPTFDGLLPGAHVVAMGPYQECIEARRAGFEVRDTVLVVSPEGTSFAFLLRKPLAGTVADNVLRHGVGALNIDGCRVAHASAADFAQHKAGVDSLKARGGSLANSWKNSSDLSGASDVTTKGRWPTNLVFVHAPECQKEGMTWACEPDCPVVALDETMDSGGASRFFPQFEGRDALLAWLARLIGVET